MKTHQSEYNNKTFRGAVQRDSNVVGERFWRDFSMKNEKKDAFLKILIRV